MSFLPTGVFNYLHYRDFSGLSQEPYLQTMATYPERLIGNIFLLIFHNVTYVDLYKEPWLKQILLTNSLGKMISHHFEEGALRIYPFYAVEQAGLGVVIVTVGISLFIITFTKKYSCLTVKRLKSVPTRPALHLIIWIFFFLFLLTSTAGQPARLVSGYYPFLLSFFFLGSILPLGSKRRWAKIIICISVAATTICLVYQTENPLIDVNENFNWVRVFEENEVIFLNQRVPESENAIGVMREWNQRESWAWKPYGSRRVYELSDSPDSAQMKAEGIHYVIITTRFMQLHLKTVTDWLAIHPHMFMGACLVSKSQPIGDYLFYIP